MAEKKYTKPEYVKLVPKGTAKNPITGRLVKKPAAAPIPKDKRYPRKSIKNIG